MPLEKDLSALISELDNDQINSWLQDLSSREVILRMPKFKFETSFSVNQALQELGIETAFSPTEADFSGMYQPDGEPLYISEVIHKAFVEVDEEGTEAAAATAIVMRASVAQPENEPLLLEFNHPFPVYNKGSSKWLDTICRQSYKSCGIILKMEQLIIDPWLSKIDQAN